MASLIFGNTGFLHTGLGTTYNPRVLAVHPKPLATHPRTQVAYASPTPQPTARMSTSDIPHSYVQPVVHNPPPNAGSVGGQSDLYASIFNNFGPGFGPRGYA